MLPLIIEYRERIFNYLPSDVQAEFASVLHEHITNAERILKSDKCILPMLAIYADDPAENELIGLQPAGKNADTDIYYHIRAVMKRGQRELFFGGQGKNWPRRANFLHRGP